MPSLNMEDTEGKKGNLEFPLSPTNALSQLYSIWVGKENSALQLTLRSEGNLQHPLFGKEAKRMEWLLAEAAENFLREGTISREGWDEKALTYVSSDGMAAWLMLIPPLGTGRQLTLLELEQQLVEQGIIFGVDQDLLSQVHSLSNPYFCLFLIACGQRPTDGKDGYIVDHIPRKKHPFSNLDELANVDYNMLHLVNKIQKGDIICEVIPPTRAIAGITVGGTPVPGCDGVKAEVPAGRNTALSEDGKYLLATRDGHVQFSGRNFLVKAVLEIPGDVDRSTESINFLGDVHIHGDVTGGCTIRAMGNIQIDGVIEICTIEAGENLVVSSGVQGQEQTLIRAHKGVYAKYLEYCTVYAHDTVQADCIIDCHICCNGIVRARAGRGVIIGGSIRASQEVTATTIGSKAERLTSIVLGGLPCERFERKQILDEYNKTKGDLEWTQRQPATPENEKELSSLRLNLRIAQMKLERFDKEYQTQFSKQRIENCCVSADVIYPVLSVTLDHETIEIDREQSHCRIAWNNGHLRQMRQS